MSDIMSNTQSGLWLWFQYLGCQIMAEVSGGGANVYSQVGRKNLCMNHLIKNIAVN